MSHVMSLAEAKDRLSEVVDLVTASHARVTITRHGHPEAVVISVEDLEELEHSIRLLSDAAAMAEIAAGRQAVERDEGFDEVQQSC